MDTGMFNGLTVYCNFSLWHSGASEHFWQKTKLLTPSRNHENSTLAYMHEVSLQYIYPSRDKRKRKVTTHQNNNGLRTCKKICQTPSDFSCLCRTVVEAIVFQSQQNVLLLATYPKWMLSRGFWNDCSPCFDRHYKSISNNSAQSWSFYTAHCTHAFHSSGGPCDTFVLVYKLNSGFFFKLVNRFRNYKYICNDIFFLTEGNQQKS